MQLCLGKRGELEDFKSEAFIYDYLNENILQYSYQSYVYSS